MTWKIASLATNTRDWLLKNSQPPADTLGNDRYQPIVFFVFSLIFYCLYLLATQPEWALGGEMWAESATNYYPNSRSPSLAVKFLSTDTGYVPLPQRILAALGYWLSLPAAAIPYFYTWSAILITACMIGAFCLAPFRVLVKSDLLRLLAALSVLLVADFESRTFINFTYFTAFFVAIVAALAFAEKSADVPVWAWFIPILMVAKPGVISALPAIITAALVSRTRFRLIAIITTILCLAQLTNMMLNPGKVILGVTLFGTADKFYASARYFLGFLGAFGTGMADSPGHYKLFFTGLGMLIVSLVTVLKTRTGAGAVVLVGLSLLLFNVTVHCFGFSGAWNIQLHRLDDIQIERHTIISFSGVILVLTGLVAAWSETLSKNRTARGATRQRAWLIGAGPVIFFAWFCLAGWLTKSGSLNRQPGPPMTNSSVWQTMSAIIDSGEAVCVPVDPMGMMYQRNCVELDAMYLKFLFRTRFEFAPIPMQGSRSVMELPPPPAVHGKHLISAGILLKHQAQQPILLNADAALRLKDGTVKYLSGSRQLPAAGGLVMLTGTGVTPISDIQQVTFTMSAPVDVGYLIGKDESVRNPVVYWMGN